MADLIFWDELEKRYEPRAPAIPNYRLITHRGIPKDIIGVHIPQKL